MIASMVWGHLRHSQSQELVNSPYCQILNEGSPVLILLPKVHETDCANRSNMAEVAFSDSRPIGVCTMCDRGHLHRVRGVINEVQHPIVAAAR